MIRQLFTGILGCLLVVVTGITGLAAPRYAAAVDEAQWQELCRFDDPRLVEISGMAPSIRHPHVVWVHNDSGDAAILYAVNTRTCETVGELRLRGVKARDFEGLASSTDEQKRAFLWVGDIGDNRDSWPDVSIHRVREPDRLGNRTRPATTWRFTYPDRPHNAETLMVLGERGWVATWQLAAGGLYSIRALAQRPTGRVSIAERVGDVGSLITDGAMHPSGHGYVLRDYLDVHVFQGLPPGRRIAKLALPPQAQGEAIAWAPDGRSVFIASENDPRLIRVDLPWWVLASLRPPDHLVD